MTSRKAPRDSAYGKKLFFAGAFAGFSLALLIATMRVQFAPPTAQVQRSFSPFTQVPLRITDISVGSGAAVAADDRVVVHYKATLEGGAVFDSTYARSRPLELIIGRGTVAYGWDTGIAGMRVGGKRTITVNPLSPAIQAQTKLPYPVPLIVEVDLLALKP